jgi:hypothetical protein
MSIQSPSLLSSCEAEQWAHDVPVPGRQYTIGAPKHKEAARLHSVTACHRLAIALRPAAQRHVDSGMTRPRARSGAVTLMEADSCVRTESFVMICRPRVASTATPCRSGLRSPPAFLFAIRLRPAPACVPGSAAHDVPPCCNYAPGLAARGGFLLRG